MRERGPACTGGSDSYRTEVPLPRRVLRDSFTRTTTSPIAGIAGVMCRGEVPREQDQDLSPHVGLVEDAEQVGPRNLAIIEHAPAHRQSPDVQSLLPGPVGAIHLPGCSNKSNISGAKGFSGSPVGSQRRQLPGDAGPRPARVAAAKQPTGRRLAPPGDWLSLYGMQEARGSSPLSSTQVRWIFRTAEHPPRGSYSSKVQQ
jgi:hypothetical protein